MILYIVRHGESLGNTGQDTGNDPVLSEKGEIQAKLLGERMKNISKNASIPKIAITACLLSFCSFIALITSASLVILWCEL